MSGRLENDSFKLLELKLNLEGNMADKIQNAYKTSKNILAKKGRFSPPCQTEKELRNIFQKLYKETDIHVDGSMVYFYCVK